METQTSVGAHPMSKGYGFEYRDPNNQRDVKKQVLETEM
jgi:hypothetical protein